MSLISDALSIISIGCSCQISEQLKRNRDVLSLETNVELRNESSYFDYVITPINSLIRMVGADFPTLTDRRAVELKNEYPYWIDQNIWFVHNFRDAGSLGNVEIDRNFDTGVSKIEHLRSKFVKLPGRSKKFIFIIANSQDLTHYAPSELEFDANFGFNMDRLQKCVDALKSEFGDSFSGLLAVEREGHETENYEIDGLFRASVKYTSVVR